MLRNLPIVVSTFIALIVLSVALMNTAPVALSLFGAQTSLSVTLVIVVALLSGIVCGASFLVLRGTRKQKANEIAAKWEAQDIKLVSQVKSDREKQLEAKIATLEAALKSALNK